ncbi:DUF3347 domain-containing protein [Segetibacter sp. 3557_3]|uniref:DUF3347 domain-containing protein n=1 Tax=Segetibacter sp. 3557_3 TaxID=2547429 RepID=UPI0010588EFE|nr:DUF3347 domain-containing protein [Segetibacter sp. 3557_3]TDH29288.1 DUF3347 domain-containing protein [Segetibacter sp. 3557_3]
MKRIVLFSLVSIMAACGGEDKKTEVDKDVPLVQSKNTSAFSESFKSLLTSYYALKDHLVQTNDSLATSSAQQVVQAATGLQLKDLKADSSIVAMTKTYVETIVAEAQGLVGEKTIEEKRKSFQMISDNMYDLIRTVRYDQEVVYHQYCPMAFSDAGAYWLSNTSDIKNPYFGKKMLECGEVKDSLDFRVQ